MRLFPPARGFLFFIRLIIAIIQPDRLQAVEQAPAFL
jgi:hypothetical protein